MTFNMAYTRYSPSKLAFNWMRSQTDPEIVGLSKRIDIAWAAYIDLKGELDFHYNRRVITPITDTERLPWED
jgi:hypothetical protein